MAVVQGIVIYLAHGAVEISWASLRNGDTGSAMGFSQYPNKTVSVRGTFGGTSTAIIVGTDSFDATAIPSWTTLNDNRGKGNPLLFTERDVRAINENPARIAPYVFGGDGNTLLTIAILCQAS